MRSRYNQLSHGAGISPDKYRSPELSHEKEIKKSHKKKKSENGWWAESSVDSIQEDEANLFKFSDSNQKAKVKKEVMESELPLL